MPIQGARYRVVTTKTGKKIRLAWVKGKVEEAKNLDTGAKHTQAEFAADRKKEKSKKHVSHLPSAGRRSTKSH